MERVIPQAGIHRARELKIEGDPTARGALF